jgi:hypothetical protein
MSKAISTCKLKPLITVPEKAGYGSCHGLTAPFASGADHRPAGNSWTLISNKAEEPGAAFGRAW